MEFLQLTIYLLKVSIRPVRIKYLITVHNRNQILCFQEVDDVMSVAGKHVDCLDMVSTYFEVQDFICAEFLFLNQAMPRYHNK